MTNTESPLDVMARVFASLSDTAERDAYIVTLRTRGWTLDPIASAAGLTRFDVRRIESRPDLNAAIALVARGVEVPSPPTTTPAPFHQRDAVTGRRLTHAPDPSPETLARLLALQPLAQQVRSSSPLYRAEAEEYTALLNHAITVEGTTVYRLAKLLKVTHGGLYARLTRYGYRPRTSNSHTTVPILPQNRYTPAE